MRAVPADRTRTHRHVPASEHRGMHRLTAHVLALLVLLTLAVGTSGAHATSAAPPRAAPIPPGAAPGPPPPPDSSLVPAQDGTGVWPLDPTPTVVERFDPPRSAYGAGHRGVDLAGRRGDRVRSALAGRVTFAGSLAGRGVVVVSHGSTRTTYEPVRASVRVGDRVGAGGTIGTLQQGGSHCAPSACLHWGLIDGDTYLDPLTLVGAGPVRLLPFLRGAPGATRDLVGGILPARADAVRGIPGAAEGHARGWAWR